MNFQALDLARTAVFSKDGNSRDDVPKIALLMTDGKSKIPLKTALAAKKLKAEGVTLVPLGIGDGVDRKELVSMASNYKDTLYVQSYAHLGAKVKDIRQRVCDGMILSNFHNRSSLSVPFAKNACLLYCCKVSGILNDYIN